MLLFRGVVPGGAGGAMAHPDFGRSVNPISTRRTDYGHLITTGTPGFSDLPTALVFKGKLPFSEPPTHPYFLTYVIYKSSLRCFFLYA